MGLVIYKSSAGSGKTFTLVQQFLIKVIGQPWLFRRILAITFTNKATEELKTRIIKELDILAHGEKSMHLEALLEKLPKLSEKEIYENAQVVLVKILHDYSSFAISTIDSYFQVLARTLARELLLPLKYNIELDTEFICKNATNNLLDEAGRDEQITNWLEKLLLHRIDEGKNWNVKTELEKMTKELLQSATARDNAASIDMTQLLDLIEWMIVRKKEVEKFMNSKGNEVIQVLEKHQLDASRFYYKTKGPVGYLLKIAHRKSGYKEFSNINTYTQSALKDPLMLLSKVDQKNESLVRIATEEIYPLLDQAVSYIYEHQRAYLSVTEALKLIYQSGISGALDEKLKEYREKNQIFHLSDTTRMLSKMVADQDAPFIYEKSGNTYLHLLIDEFQDTGTEQWKILKPLVLNSLSTGNEVILVGDAKQSIYRWRGGNMQLILDGVEKELKKSGFPLKNFILGTNYRSKKNIVEFNNTLFPAAAKILSAQFKQEETIFQLAYHEEQVFQKSRDKGSEGGYIQIDFFESEKAKKEDLHIPIHWKTKALIKMDEIVEDLLSKAYQLKDITIIFRNNKHEKEIADYLFNQGKYPFISTNSLLLSTHPKVNLLLNCLKLLLKPDSPLLYEEIDLHALSNSSSPDFPFQSIRMNKSKNSWAKENLINQREKFIALPLDIIVHHIQEMLHVSVTDPFIQKFNDLVKDFSSSINNTIAGFIQWWDEHEPTRKWSVNLDEGGDAIRMISIHRSKGLEFPVVIIPFLDWEYTPNNKSILWVKSNEEKFAEHSSIPVQAVKSLNESYFSEDYYQESLNTALDNINLLYVAFTRPEEKLFIISPKNPAHNDIGSLLMGVLSTQEEWHQQNADLETKTFTFGINESKTTKASASSKASLYSPSSFSMVDFPKKRTSSTPSSTLENFIHE
ncbi:MAG: UvrD-helicase domain-containing protein [Bacteroidetes bacterium]|nr:UvrD-helicase domain-containing protein [Bacteroidota bacterium]